MERGRMDCLLCKFVKSLIHLAVMFEHFSFKLVIEQIFNLWNVEKRYANATVLTLFAREYTLKTPHIAIIDNGSITI